MTDLPQRKSIRLKNYDYSSSGWYFVTICTQNRKCLFGNIVGVGLSDPSMILNDVGKMVNQWWLKMQKRFKNVTLDEYKIMPNHVHGIIITDGRENRAPTLGQIVGFFKYQSTKQINNHSVGAGIIPPKTIRKIWQRNYYEHIIRTGNDLNKIRQYIQDNPRMWDRDRNNPRNYPTASV